MAQQNRQILNYVGDDGEFRIAIEDYLDKSFSEAEFNATNRRQRFADNVSRKLDRWDDFPVSDQGNHHTITQLDLEIIGLIGVLIVLIVLLAPYGIPPPIIGLFVILYSLFLVIKYFEETVQI